MVGRLVEQQEIGGFRDQPGQIHPPALPVGQLTHAQAQVRGAEEAEGEQGVGVFVGEPTRPSPNASASVRPGGHGVSSCRRCPTRPGTRTVP